MRGAAGKVREEARGFTLVELMVVLVILGLASAAVILTLPERGGSLVAEAERFAARTKAARDDAILDSRAATVAVGPGGYEVTRRSEAAHYDWVAGTEPALAGGREGRIRFGATGLADPAQVVLRRGGRVVAIDVGGDGSVRVQR
jgi:general secretion pathway protein H